MTKRGYLRSHLKQAWFETIREAYPRQLINSERALQVQFSSRLMAIFARDRVHRSLFVEPKLVLRDGQRVHPDLLICNSRQIIGAIELKYQPNVRARYTKDLATLEALASQGGSMTLENNRYRGPGQGELRFSLSVDPLYVWAGVYRAPMQEIPIVSESSIDNSQVLILHGVAHKDREPDILVQSGKRTSRL